MRTINYFSNEHQIKGAMAANAIRACRSLKRLRRGFGMSLKQVRMIQEMCGLAVENPDRLDKKSWYDKGE